MAKIVYSVIYSLTGGSFSGKGKYKPVGIVCHNLDRNVIDYEFTNPGKEELEEDLGGILTRMIEANSQPSSDWLETYSERIPSHRGRTGEVKESVEHSNSRALVAWAMPQIKEGLLT